MAQADDDEWEYIYDATETETLTFTIDFTTGGPGSGSTPATDITTAQSSDAQTQDNSGGPTVESQVPPRGKSAKTVQFLDLPSKAPYISYSGQVFTGTWGETLGSDLLFGSTKDVPNDVTPVVQEEDGKWCLLGVSQTTLVAKPVELIKRSRVEIASANASDASTAKPNAQKPFTVVLKSDADAKLRRQAAYLEQLQAVKMARGDTDIVYLGKTMRYLGADGKKKKAPDFSQEDLERMNEGGGSKSHKRMRMENGVDDGQGSEQDVYESAQERNSQEEMDDVDDSNDAIDPDLELNNVDIDRDEPAD